MSQPAHYQQVIQRVIERNLHKNWKPEQLAEAIVDGLDLAEALLGDGPVEVIRATEDHPSIFRSPDGKLVAGKKYADVLIQTSRPEPHYPQFDTSGAMLIGTVAEEAPPAAVVRNPGAASVQLTYAEAEEQKTALFTKANQMLPMTLTADLPGIGELQLSRFIKRGPEGVEFIRILYALSAEDEDGPQVQLLVGKPFDPEMIKKEILTQAAGRYRKTRPVIEPRPAKNPGMPDIEGMAFSPTAADLGPVPQDEIDDWKRLSGSTTI